MSDWIWWEQITWGFRLRSGSDVIRVTSVEDGTPGQIEFVFSTAPYIWWGKAIQVVDSPVWFGYAWTNRDDHGPRSLIVPVIPVLIENAALEFVKTAWFGIWTGYYKVGDLLRYRDKKVTIEWQWDWGGDTVNGNSVPAPAPPVPGA